MKYFDSKGTEIQAGMHLRFPDGSIEKIYATVDAHGNPDLGINASNDDYMRLHGLTEMDREFYSLSSFYLYGTEVCEPEQAMAESGPSLSM